MKKDAQFSVEISEIKTCLPQGNLGAASPSLISFLKLSSGEEFDNVKNNVKKDNPTNNNTKNMDDGSKRGLSGSMGASSSGGKSPGGKISGLFSRAKTAAQNSMGRVELQTTKEESDIQLLEEYVSKLEIHCLGDPVAVCTMKMVNVCCYDIIVDDEHVIMRDAVRLGGLSMNVRPLFWMCVTLEKCGPETDKEIGENFDYADNLTILKKQGREGKWQRK